MRNQRTSAIIAAVAVVVVVVATGFALRFGQFPGAWRGTLCEQIKSAIVWTEGRIKTEPAGTEAHARFLTDKGELEKQLADANCASDAPQPTESTTPTVAPTSAPTAPVPTDADEECTTRFFTNDPNKVSTRSFGPPVKDTGVTKVTKEYYRRLELDPALLAENLNVLGIRQDSKAGQQKLAEKLVKDCDARTEYVSKIRDLLDDAKVSIEHPKAQIVGSAYMVDGPNDVPLVEWAPRVERGEDYVVLQIILPSGEKVWFRLKCGFQYDKPGKPVVRRSVVTITECVSGQPHDSEGNCPTTGPSATPTPTPTTTTTPRPCPPWEDGTVPPRNPEDNSCPKGPDGPPPPTAHTPAPSPTGSPESTASVEPDPADSTTKPGDSITDVPAPGASSAPAQSAAPDKVDPKPSATATGDVDPEN